MFCSPVFSEEQYEYVQSAAPAGCMESKRVERATKPKSVDVNRLSIVKSGIVVEGGTSAQVEVCARFGESLGDVNEANAVASLSATKTAPKGKSDWTPPFSGGRYKANEGDSEDGVDEAGGRKVLQAG